MRNKILYVFWGDCVSLTWNLPDFCLWSNWTEYDVCLNINFANELYRILTYSNWNLLSDFILPDWKNTTIRSSAVPETGVSR